MDVPCRLKRSSLVCLQAFMEAPGLGSPDSPLQFVFYGSNQEQVASQKDKWLNAIHGAGVEVGAVTLPPAPVGLLHAIMVHNKQASPLLVGSAGCFLVSRWSPRSQGFGQRWELAGGPLVKKGLVRVAPC
jgi:hypothetical protein